MIALVSPFVFAAQSRKQSVQVGSAELIKSGEPVDRAIEINRKSGLGRRCLAIDVAL
jgi:hypothetical protein